MGRKLPWQAESLLSSFNRLPWAVSAGRRALSPGSGGVGFCAAYGLRGATHPALVCYCVTRAAEFRAAESIACMAVEISAGLDAV